ncbi:MAG: hypothetical protein SFU86_04625 [Pirellulaceae bacterium]|nr:hypothetical protein [Pirellulaceae bacterium]
MEAPPPPTKPEREPAPSGNWWSIPLLGLFAFGVATLLTFLTLGWFGPIVLLGFAIFGIIGLQYLLWGWWFERIYRSNLPPEGSERDV